MPKRTDLKSILIIGAGPIVIGQACEFDYSGAQACKALREEGYKVILVNSNPATIMTDPEMADVTYIEPIMWQTVEKIIAKERPDAILPTMGGQTALNCALDLARNGVLAKYNVELIGATEDAIDKAEDRGRFKEAMEKIGLSCPKSFVCHTMNEALAAQEQVGFPTLIRPSFTMGGSGGGIAYNKDEFLAICERGFDASPTHELLIEQSVLGWKEYEMEVVRDKNDNCIIICSIENFDPMGVHTGDSITVAPAQTLTDKEYQIMRNASLAVLREIGVDTGGSNVQFAVNPENGEMIVIEMNPRVSRSSALASKATGFPIAKVAAKLAVGFTLDELRNDITGGRTPASFEPSIDYVVTKIPRFAFEKFPAADDRLTTQMKSVGEVMAMGRTIQESFQKALRGLETGLCGFNPRSSDKAEIRRELANPGPERMLFVADAFRAGFTLEEIHEICAIDPWFLAQIEDLVKEEQQVSAGCLQDLDFAALRRLKRKGFSDKRIAQLLGVKEKEVREHRYALNLHPVYKRVDTCAAEFATETAYLYSTYEEECEARPSDRKKVMILGGGPNRIGQGIEFDYCCVHAALALRESGFETIMVNCNPETVSTDFDTSDRLYFEPLTLEDVLEIVRTENPWGVIVHYGGQTPLKLANALVENGVNIIGTSADSIDAAEDRERFQKVLNDLGLRQPPNRIAHNEEEALVKAEEIGYPLVVRPSYVLGGRAMQVVHSAEELQKYMREAVQVSEDSPVLLDFFLNNAIEVDVDCVSDGKDVVIGGIMQHVEQAGIHSGDSACALPPMTLGTEDINKVRESTAALAHGIGVRGLINVQFALKDDILYVIEANPRASRTVPFVSKATGVPLAKAASRIMLGATIAELQEEGMIPTSHDGGSLPLDAPIAVKEAVLPFTRFRRPDGSMLDSLLSPEMKSTGEVMGLADNFGAAYAKAEAGAFGELPTSGTVFVSVANRDKRTLIFPIQRLASLGFTMLATAGTAGMLRRNGIPCETVLKHSDIKAGTDGVSIVDRIKNGEVDLILNTPAGSAGARHDGYDIRAAAVNVGIPLVTTVQGVTAAVQGIEALRAGELSVRALQELDYTED